MDRYHPTTAARLRDMAIELHDDSVAINDAARILETDETIPFSESSKTAPRYEWWRQTSKNVTGEPEPDPLTGMTTADKLFWYLFGGACGVILADVLIGLAS